MRAIVVIAVCLALIFGASAVSLAGVTRTAEEFTALADQAQARALAGDADGAEEALRELEAAFERREVFLGCILNHARLEEVDTQLLRTLAMLETENLAGFLRESALLQHEIEHLYVPELPRISNLL